MSTPPKVITFTDVKGPKPLGPFEDFADGCKWIHGDPLKPGWRTCNHPLQEGSSFCEHHHARSWVKKKEAIGSNPMALRDMNQRFKGAA